MKPFRCLLVALLLWAGEAAAAEPLPAAAYAGWLALPLLLVLGAGCRLRQQRLLAAAQAEAERLRGLLEAAPAAMVKIDRNGLITLVNAQAEACFGYSRDEMLGRPVEMLVPERFRSGHQLFRADFLQRPQTRVMGAGRELFGLRKDGSEFPLEIGLNPIQTDQGVAVISSVVDISERRRLEDRFRLVVEATPNAVVVTNRQGVIELINSQTEKLFGYTRDELLGLSVDVLVPPRLRGQHPQYRASYLHQPQTRPMGSGRELYGLRKDGSEFPVEIGLNPISTGQGMLVLSSIIDISARKQAEEQLRQQAGQLATASRYKSEFLANMSHELRTPLNSILILSEQLHANTSGNLSQRQIEHADIIYRSGSDLLNLINDILDLSKIEAGRVVVAQEAILLTDLADNIRRTFTPQAELKNLAFSVDLAGDAPVHVVSDYQRLFQILKNLIANALKFTSHGAVRVRFELLPGPPVRFCIAVADSGPGIPADKHELVFQAFRQVDGSTSRQYGGSGLGLTISRQLAELLGGELLLQSREGEGCTFTLSLPLPLLEAAAEPAPVREDRALFHAAAAPAGELAAAANGEKILLVDDDVRNIYAMTSMLEAQGFDVCSARNGEDAIRLLQAQPEIDLVLMDMMMPVLDGYGATRRLRSELHFLRPIIAVTACAMKGDQEKCLAAGADDYLSKPVNRAELVGMIRKWLDAARQEAGS